MPKIFTKWPKPPLPSPLPRDFPPSSRCLWSPSPAPFQAPSSPCCCEHVRLTPILGSLHLSRNPPLSVHLAEHLTSFKSFWNGSFSVSPICAWQPYKIPKCPPLLAFWSPFTLFCFPLVTSSPSDIPHNYLLGFLLFSSLRLKCQIHKGKTVGFARCSTQNSIWHAHTVISTCWMDECADYFFCVVCCHHQLSYFKVEPLAVGGYLNLNQFNKIH